MKTLIQNIRLLSVCAVLCGMVAGTSLYANFQQSDNSQKQSLTVTRNPLIDKETGLPMGKKLMATEMNFLNTALEKMPDVIGKMCLSYRKAFEVNKKLASDSSVITSNDLMSSINNILAPVKEFLQYAHDYGHFLLPLVEESLLAPELRLLPQEEKFNLCLFLSFFKSKMEIHEFFVSHVKTKDDLNGVCLEFMTFFEDLFASLSTKTLQPYKKMLEEIRAKKK